MSRDATDEVVVPLEKMTIVGLVFLGVIMAAVAIWVCLLPDPATRYPALLLRAAGAVGGALFGFMSLVHAVRLFDSGPGLIVDRDDLDGPAKEASVGIEVLRCQDGTREHARAD